MNEIPHEFTEHSHLTDPGKHAELLDDLPGDVAALQECIHGLLVHGDYQELYGIPAIRWSRETLPVEKRIEWIMSRCGFPLIKSRPIYWRAIGTCRDIALMTCSFLRHKNIPARLRCGFATYLAPGRFEDHWVCEYWHPDIEDWVIADSQLDNAQCRHLDIEFDTACLPDGAFVSANQAWDMYRKQGIGPALFGHGDACGEWFIWVNLARDCLALHGQETSAWDTWRETAGDPPVLSDDDRENCDRIAGHIQAPGQPVPASLTRPFWTA